MPTLREKLELAKQYLGDKWVLATRSTYDARRRERGLMCQTLRPIVVEAMIKGRL